MRQNFDLEQVFANADLGRIAAALEAIAKQQDIMTTVLSNMNTRDRMMLAAVERIAAVLEAQQPPVIEWERATAYSIDEADAMVAQGWRVAKVQDDHLMSDEWCSMERPLVAGHVQPAPVRLHTAAEEGEWEIIECHNRPQYEAMQRDGWLPVGEPFVDENGRDIFRLARPRPASDDAPQEAVTLHAVKEAIRRIARFHPHDGVGPGYREGFAFAMRAATIALRTDLLGGAPIEDEPNSDDDPYWADAHDFSDPDID